MKKFTRILCILLTCLMVVTILACNSSDGGGDNKTTSDNKATADGETGGDDNVGDSANTTEEEVKMDGVTMIASLPDADYEGYEFRIWTSNWFNETLEGRQAPEEEQISEPINDALYIRDKLVEEKYKIDIKYTIVDDYNTLTSRATKSVKAGDDSFDFVMGDMMNVTKGLAQTGAVCDFNTIPNIDLSNPWWSQFAIRDLTINGKFFFPTGDITARYPGSQAMIFFNKQIFLDAGIDYPYQSVLEGTWTLDAFRTLLKDTTRDLDGDGVYGKDDFYGFIGNSSGYNLYRSAGESLVKIVDGEPVINVNSEKSQTVINELMSFMGQENYMYYNSAFQSYDEVPMFKENRMMMMIQTGTNASLYRDMESDFGIIPIPKFNEMQTDYNSFCQAWGSAAVCVPRTNENLERTGMIIEALAAVGKYTSTPAAYEVTLKTKYSRDNDSEEMLDIIVAGSCYDLAMMFDWGTLYSSFYKNMDQGLSFVSKYESIEAKVQAAMDKTVNVFMSVE